MTPKEIRGNMKSKYILESNLFTFVLLCFLQLVFLFGNHFLDKFFGPQDPILIIIFVYSIYLGSQVTIFKNILLLLKKGLVIIGAIAFAYLLHNLYYSIWVNEGTTFITEFSLGGGYNLTMFGLVILLMLPTWCVGLLFGSLIPRLSRSHRDRA